MGGVILPSPNPVIGQFEKENGIPKGTVIEAIRQNGASSYWSKLERGEVHPTEFEAGFSKELEDVAGRKCKTEGLVNFIESKLENPIQDTIDTIDRLKKLNIPVALLTNNWFIENGQTN